MPDEHATDSHPTEETLPIEQVLPGARLAELPAGQSWVGALLLIKTRDDGGELTWSVRRTDGLGDEELYGMVSVQAEMLRENLLIERRASQAREVKPDA